MTACGNPNVASKAKSNIAVDQSFSREAEFDVGAAEIANESNQSSNSNQQAYTDRMIAYEADLYIAINGLEKSVEKFQQEIIRTGGYIVESSIVNVDEGRRSATVFARIPKDQFEQFLIFVEENSEKINERNVHGLDVTEEYVDLDSRLKAKRLIEERLLDFMKRSEKTEDLLKISKDLGQVQEEIEQIVGRMKYLQNRTELAAVKIHMEDVEVIVPPLNKEDLNTWQQAKKNFVDTINGLKSFTSSFIIFLIGFSPILILIGLIAFLVVVIVRKRNATNNSKDI